MTGATFFNFRTAVDSPDRKGLRDHGATYLPAYAGFFVSQRKNPMNVLTRERQQDAESEALAKSAAMLSSELLAALRKGDLSAPALFAPQVTDWSAHYLPGIASRTKRYQTVGEVVLGQLSGTLAFDALTQLICRIAYSADANLPHVARSLLKNITDDFGDNNANGETA